MRDLQSPRPRWSAWVAAIYCSLYPIHNPLKSLLRRVALRLNQLDATAAALLALIPLLATVVYCSTLESWSVQLMQPADARLQSS